MRCSPLVFLACFLAVPIAAQAAPDVAWRTDFDGARRHAAESGQLLFVGFVQHGDPDAAKMLQVYSNPRVGKALAATTAVIACSFADDQAGDASALYGAPADQLRSAERSARLHLFGTRNVTPNQQVILFPDGSVAWHGLHACSSSKLLSALRIATSQLRQSPEARQRVHVRNASKLVRRARKDADAYLKLVTELRNSSHLGFWEILPSRQQYSALNERLLRDVTRDMPLESGAHLMATNVPGGLEPIAQKMRDDIEQQRAQIRAQLALDGPLPDLGRVAELDGIKFTDGVERRLSDGTDRVTVLWFFVPGRPSLPTEVAAIELVADELAAQGVRMLGLAAAIEPAASQEAVRSAGVPFPSAPYLYDQTDARAGVTMFPSAVVLDRDGTVVYRSSQKPDRSPRQYIEFAQWVRALLAQPRDA